MLFRSFRCVFPDSNDNAFTHLELQFDLSSNPVYAEFSRLSLTENNELPENIDPQSLVLSPYIPQVQIYDLIIDSTYERVWKITNVQNLVDRTKNPYGWDVTARLVQRFELPSLLFLRRIEQRHNKFAQPHRIPDAVADYDPYIDADQSVQR